MAQVYKSSIRVVAEQIAYDYNKSADIPFIRRLEASIINYRATIIRQDYNKTGSFSASLEDSFCLQMKQVSATECCVDADSNFKIYRTVDKIPAPIRVKDGSTFTYVGDLRRQQGYSYIVPEEFDTIQKGTRFGKYRKYFAYYNRYIYTFNSPNKRVRVAAIFDNPTELLTLMNCDGYPCIDDVMIPQDMVKIIKDWIKIELSGKEAPSTKDVKLDEYSNKN